MSTAVTMPAAAPRHRFFDALAPGGRKVFFVLGLIGVCLLFAFPVLWLILTSLRPSFAVNAFERIGVRP